MKILKLQEDRDYVDDLVQKIYEKDIEPGEKFAVSFKRGCRRKIKKLRLISVENRCLCECCGPFIVIELKRGNTKIVLDSQIGAFRLIPFLQKPV